MDTTTPSMLRVTPIYGSRFQSASPSGNCTLVEYARVRVLVNVGLQYLDEHHHRDLYPPHDVLIVSDSTLQSLGNLPLYCQQFPSTTILATFPTVKMGQMTLWDYHAQISLDGGKPQFSLQDIDVAIRRLQTIKYSQSVAFGGDNKEDNKSLSVTAHRAGHVVGAAVWTLRRFQDETRIVITPNTYSIAKEQHLDSSTLLKHGATPDVLITRPGGPALPLAHSAMTSKRAAFTTVSQSQKLLLESILSVLRREGNVLLPVDASGRVLELVLLLNQYWEKQRLGGTYNLVWLAPMVGNTLEFARSQLEWMHDRLGTQFDNSKHPFGLSQVQLCNHLDQLPSFSSSANSNANGNIGNNSNPTCVLACGMSLDHGPARDLLLRYASNDNHAIIFTDTAQCWQRDIFVQGKMTEQQKTKTSNAATSTTGTTTATTGATASSTPAVEQVAAPDEADDTEVHDANEGRFIHKTEMSQYTAAYQLLQHWCDAQRANKEMPDSVEVDVWIPRRAPLVGPELQHFLELEEKARQEQILLKQKEQMLQEMEVAKGRLRLSEEKEDPQKSINIINPNLKYMRSNKKGRLDSNLFLKFSKPLHMTFLSMEDEVVGIGTGGQRRRQGESTSLGIDLGKETMEDDYGIAVDTEHFVDIVTGVDPSKFGSSGRVGDEVLRRGLGYGTSADITGSKKRKNEDDEEEEDDLDERGMEAMDLSEGRGIIRGRNGRPPTKVTTEPRRIQVFCEIDYIPLEGRVDARAARQSVRALQPRQVVVLGGEKKDTTEDTEEIVVDEVRLLAEAAESFFSTPTEVRCPGDSETVELQVGHSAFDVRLISNPYRTPEDQKKGEEEGEPEPMDLHEFKLGACTVSLLDYVATGQRVALDGSIVLAPRKHQISNPLSIYVSDGDVLLTDLRTDLIAQGMKAEYSTHAGYARLVVNGKVVVKKEKDSGRINVEGPLCEDFFTVRSVVCSQYVAL